MNDSNSSGKVCTKLMAVEGMNKTSFGSRDGDDKKRRKIEISVDEYWNFTNFKISFCFQ